MKRIFIFLSFNLLLISNLMAKPIPKGEMLTEKNGHYIAPGSFHPREYCIRKSYAKIKAICEDYEIDDDGNHLALLNVVVNIAQNKFEWCKSHVSYLSDCAKLRARLNKSFARIPNNALFCIQGWSLEPDPEKDPEPTDKKYGAIVENIYYNDEKILQQ